MKREHALVVRRLRLVGVELATGVPRLSVATARHDYAMSRPPCRTGPIGGNLPVRSASRSAPGSPRVSRERVFPEVCVVEVDRHGAVDVIVHVGVSTESVTDKHVASRPRKGLKHGV